MLSYLKDTNAVEVYDGANWVASDDPNAIQNTIVDAKGDLITATAADTPARLAVGNSGETLVADSSATTGLSYKEDYAAGKNKIINGDFNINQRAFTTTTTDGAYTFDRWRNGSDALTTVSAQTFTPGAAPVSDYESTNFIRLVSAGQSAAGAASIIAQRFEDVRTLTGTVTISFWAKAGSGAPKLSLEIDQQYGSGGSTRVTNDAGQVTLSTSWVRYSKTVTVSSFSGKTIGAGNFAILNIFCSAGSNFNARTGSLGIQSNTFDIWGVQVEAGSVATAFQTATGTLQGELAACMRYCYKFIEGTGKSFGTGANYTAGVALAGITLPVPMRTTPTLVATSGSNFYGFYRDGVGDFFDSVTLSDAGPTAITLNNSSQISGTSGHAGVMITANASASIIFTAEL
jgi:hypothetical protein